MSHISNWPILLKFGMNDTQLVEAPEQSFPFPIILYNMGHLSGGTVRAILFGAWNYDNTSWTHMQLLLR
jgi:hypothetical protein